MNQQKSVKAPWLDSYGNVPRTIDYPDCSMFQLIEENAKGYENYTAYDFMGKGETYGEFIKKVYICARGLAAEGFREGDRITVCMPNTPQAVIMFLCRKFNRMRVQYDTSSFLRGGDEVLSESFQKQRNTHPRRFF